MISIDNNNIITLNRGDSFKSPLFINKGSDLNPMRYILKDGDEVYFALMEPNQLFEEAIIRKKYTNLNLNKYKDVVIQLNHEDTASLYPGKYYYQIKIKLLNETQINHSPITIKDDSSMLKKGTLLIKGSIINGVPIEPNIDNKFYLIPTDVICNKDDFINEDSILKSDSIINGNKVETSSEVNTLIQKTEINLME